MAVSKRRAARMRRAISTFCDIQLPTTSLLTLIFRGTGAFSGIAPTKRTIPAMNPSLSEALAERGFDQLTPVQQAVSDPDLASADLLVSAQTGSGKTVGFGLAIAPTLLGDAAAFERAGVPMALVVAPTRELAFQVMRELQWLYARTGAQIASCVGGMDMRDERRRLDRGAHIVVGTPGRLRDHIMRGSLNLSGLRAVVLDEADEMLDLGFREDLEFMLGEAPAERRTLLFSATVPPMIAKLAQQYQRDAQRINTVTGAKQHADISYQAVRVAPRDQENAIFNLLRYHDADSAIVFANTRAAVNHLMARLSNRGFSVVSLSGELTQTERTNALQAMRDGRAKVCVATDVAARGIDLPNLSLVIHADLPTNTESLLHRSGRTGRAGRKGVSAMVVPPGATKKAERLLKWAKITAEWKLPPSADDIRKLDEQRLLDDPVWQQTASDEEADFAKRLLERQSAEQIAAAYLRLYRAGRSAPEELLPPPAPGSRPERGERGERADRKPFGPSTWVSLSVGRDDRAEPRWILPLLCRAGGLDKTAIGAIRVQDNETFVELSTPAVDGFFGALGADAVVEDGMTATRLDAPPKLSAPSRRPQGGPGGGDRRKPHGGGGGHGGGPRKPYGGAPRDDNRAPQTPRPKPKAAPKPKAPTPAEAALDTGALKPKKATKYADRPAPKPGKGKPGTGPKAGGPKSGGPKPKSKPRGDAPAAKRKSADAYAGARDASKRFTPPGKKAKPAGGKRRGGEQPPKRKK